MIFKQRGFTLIELLIGMTLGLSIIAGTSSLFVQMQKSFSLQRNLNDMTNDAIYMLDVLTNSILLAGYTQNGTKSFSNNTVFTISGSPTVPSFNFSNSNEYIRGIDDDAKGDQLVYRYKLSDVAELSNSVCTNTTLLKSAYAAGKTVTVRIYRRNDTDLKTFVFYCKAGIDATIEDAQPLISDVEKLVFKYGVQNKTTHTFYYTDAKGVTDWTTVFSMVVFVVLRSAEDNLTSVKMSYDVDGATYTATDNRLYKVFSKTIYLRATE